MSLAKKVAFGVGGALLGGFLLPGNIGYVAGKGFFGSVKGWQVGSVFGLSLHGLMKGSGHVDEEEVTEWRDTPCRWCGKIARENVGAAYEMEDPVFLCLHCAMKVMEGKLSLKDVRAVRDSTRSYIRKEYGFVAAKLTNEARSEIIRQVQAVYLAKTHLAQKVA